MQDVDKQLLVIQDLTKRRQSECFSHIRHAPHLTCLPVLGSTIAKSSFENIFNGSLEFVTSWKIIKMLMTHPALGGEYSFFVK